MADEDFGVVSRDGAGVAVAVADADGGDAGGAIEDGSAAVGDAVAGGEVADEGDTGLEGHDRLEFGLEPGEGGAAVEHEAGADEVGGVGLVGEEAGGVGEMNPEPGTRSPEGRGETLDEGVELVELLFGEFRVFVGGGEVGAEAGEAEVGEGVDVGDGGGGLIGEDAAAAHAGVDGEVDIEGLAGGGGEGVEVGGFVEGGEAGDPAVGDDFGAFFIEAGAEEVDGGLDVGGGEAAGFADIGDAEEGEVLVIEGAGEGFEAVAVGVGFDDGHEMLAAEIAGHGEVVAEGGEVDFGPGAGGADGGVGHVGGFEH